MDNNGFNYFENSRYIDNRIQRKTLILDVKSSDSSTIDTNGNFNIQLDEPLSINKESDIYLDSFTTYNAKQNKAVENTQMGFLLKINEFNIQTISTVQGQNGKIIIPNEDDGSGGNSVKVHKGKKLNYICSINPSKISSITGSITKLDGNTTMFATHGRFIAEFVFVSKKD